MKKIFKKNLANERRGVTLVELLVSSGIVLIAIIGILASYMRCLQLSEISRNSSIALNTVKSKIEEIKNTQFNQIFANYNNVTIPAPQVAGQNIINGIGVSYVDNTNPELLRVTVTFCWRQSDGRIMGEDTNLNGALNGGEDTNTNGILDSPVQLVSYIYDVAG